MGEAAEVVVSIPATPTVISIQSPLPSPAATKSPWTPPKAIASMRHYLEEVGHLTRLDPQDAWLPITESRNGNTAYAAFHTLSAGIGAQALLLPVAFTFLGWIVGILCLCIAFSWQLYTLWLLTQIHESIPGTRCSRYIQLATTAFGDKLGKVLVKFPIMYLSAGTCTALIVIGGGSMKLFYQTVCSPLCRSSSPLTTIEWYLVFVCLAMILAQFPNLNSIAGISLISAVSAIAYCTLIWVITVSKGRVNDVSYDPPKPKSDIAQVFQVLNAVGIVAFAFRGHNLTLEIQATMPSTLKHPSHEPMWKGIKFAYFLIALCLFPIAIGGYWAYGNLIPSRGILNALYKMHGHETSRTILELTSLLVISNCLSSFQIYAMPVFDNWESIYTSKKNRPCPRWVRSIIRSLFCAAAFLVTVAFPFLPSLAGLLGGISLPVTLAYPCFIWIVIKKPEKHSAEWYINWGLGCLGMVLSFLLVAGGIWSIVETRMKFRFFKTL